MRNQISKLLFIGVLLIPTGLIIALPYLGNGHPLEHRKVEVESLLVNSVNELEIVFFGYAGCTYICPNSLFVLGEVLDSLKLKQSTLQFGGVFIDINAETQIKRANAYSSAFSKYIIGNNVDNDELDKLRKQFGLSILKKDDGTDEIFHTDHFFVLKKKNDDWEIERVISNQTKKQVIYEVVNELLNEMK